MKLRALFPFLLLLIVVGTAFAQEHEDADRIDNARRARPALDPDFREREDDRSFLMSVPLAGSPALFFNRDMILDDSAGQGEPQNESSIAINPKNPNVIISSAVDYRPGLHVYISTDGGKSWSNKALGLVHPGWQTGNDPSVGFDANGTCFVVYGGFPDGNNTGESGVYIAKSTDNGATWTPHVPVIEHVGTMTSDSAFEDKYYIQIDNSTSSPYKGMMYIPWKRVINADSSTQIVISRSTDGGATWGAPVPVSPRKSGTSTDTTFGQSFPLSTTGPDGTVYVVWNDGPSRSIGFAKSTDGGKTFSAPTFAVRNYPTLGTPRKVGSDVYHVLKGTFRAESYPTLMADNSNSTRRGWLYLAWAAGKSPNIYFVRSSDGGATWSPWSTISTDTTNDQWWPWLSVDQTNGDIAVMYADSRNDPSNIKIDNYLSYSRDGGSTWVDRCATDTMSDYRDNPFANHIFAGDYSGNAFYNGRIYPSFLDTRKAGDNDVYTVLINLRQPYPVDNLAVRGYANQPEKATLTWDLPSVLTESVFGYPVTGYTITVERDGVPITSLPAGSTTFSEDGLVLGQNYLYSVVVVSAGDTSAPRSVTFEPFRPAPPQITGIGDFSLQVAVTVKISTFRSDKVTPLTNLHGYRIYRDSVLIHEETLTASDTGRTLTFVDTPPERGYYRYYAAVIDTSHPVNESVWSLVATAYAGGFTPYTMNFDAGMPRLLAAGTWGLTSSIALSEPSSLTDSPAGLYLPSRNDSVLFFPVAMTGPVELSFAHIAIVHPTDSAVVEVSYDRRKSWTKLASFNFNTDQSWKDTVANPGDWKRERFVLNHPTPGPDSYGVLRFRLKTSSTANADGWYIDDVQFGEPAAVEAEPGRSVAHARVRPNPFNAAAIIDYDLARRAQVHLVVVDQLGRVVATLVDGMEEGGPHAATFDGSDLPEGAYFYRLTVNGDSQVGGMVLTR